MLHNCNHRSRFCPPCTLRSIVPKSVFSVTTYTEVTPSKGDRIWPRGIQLPLLSNLRLIQQTQIDKIKQTWSALSHYEPLPTWMDMALLEDIRFGRLSGLLSYASWTFLRMKYSLQIKWLWYKCCDRKALLCATCSELGSDAWSLLNYVHRQCARSGGSRCHRELVYKLVYNCSLQISCHPRLAQGCKGVVLIYTSCGSGMVEGLSVILPTYPWHDHGMSLVCPTLDWSWGVAEAEYTIATSASFSASEMFSCYFQGLQPAGHNAK